MLLFAQFYQSEGDCGVDPAAARALREALVPLQNAALADAVG